MIRTVLTADKNTLSLKIPDKYIGKLIEIIAFAVDEPGENILTVEKIKKTWTALKLNTKNFKFNRDEANER